MWGEGGLNFSDKTLSTFTLSSFQTHLKLMLPAMHRGGWAALPFLGPRPFLVVCTILCWYFSSCLYISGFSPILWYSSCGLYIFGFSPSSEHRNTLDLGLCLSSSKGSHVTSSHCKANAENMSYLSLISCIIVNMVQIQIALWEVLTLQQK